MNLGQMGKKEENVQKVLQAKAEFNPDYSWMKNASQNEEKDMEMDITMVDMPKASV